MLMDGWVDGSTGRQMGFIVIMVCAVFDMMFFSLGIERAL